MKSSETLATATFRIFPKQLNNHGTVFGGQMMAWLDDVTSVSAQRFARAEIVTGSFDHIRFEQPAKIGDALEIQTYVTGVGTRSLEVFAKLIGEHLMTGERFLVGTAFATYVVVGPDYVAPSLAYDTVEAQAVHAGYAERRSQGKLAVDLDLS
ncbi:acyl-CoA thioesterase [Lacticaseibacillus brantae]|uniref:Acyl-CoA hydrolase n=1 Tax=Lacticaseibacillus brantae DSM 23927 TaxID=1423727 RepID=A0A0R2AZ51_9LACO|nr:acyl-CoA thioesterase [Lacticaseibacillus brantae]KRM72223.1 Acyl-CoA hydrolase [Lacticaseibacillus brantae DSM 23927]